MLCSACNTPVRIVQTQYRGMIGRQMELTVCPHCGQSGMQETLRPAHKHNK